MYVVKRIESRFTVLLVTLILICLTGYADYITGYELSFSFFYLIPISLLAIYRGTKLSAVLISSFFSTLLWFFAEFTSRDYSHILFPIWNAFARLIIFTTIGILIFYLKEKDKKMKLINDHLKLINEEKNKFVGIAAHDLRNPIGGIASLSDLVIHDYKDSLHPAVLEILQLIRETSNNILILLKDLLDITKIESGRVELNLKKRDYIAFIKKQIILSQILADRKNISILFLSQIESVTINFDENYLREVIDNLLSNAIKFSKNDSEIIVRISYSENNLILTEVVDNGIGIPLDEQQKLFNYFQTTTTKPTDGEQSTGLGLAIAKRIVTLHSGEISLKSDPINGSNFYYTLPNH
jgi:signal transduction histidine kinase